MLPDPAAHTLVAIVASNSKVAHSATIWMRTPRHADLEADAAQAQALAQIAAAAASEKMMVPSFERRRPARPRDRLRWGGRLGDSLASVRHRQSTHCERLVRYGELGLAFDRFDVDDLR